MEQQIKSKERKSGIELLRILAILMVISLHRAGHQTLYSAPQFSLSYYVLWFVEIAGYKAVDIFFIISGYFCVTQKFKSKKLLLLDFKVLIYCVGFYILSVGVKYQMFNPKDFIRAFLPYLGGHYWYYTAYISLMLLSPFVNKMIYALNKKKLLLLIVLVTGVSTISIGDAFFTNDGYSVFWAFDLYLIGAYIRLYLHKLPRPKMALSMSFACTIFIYAWFVIVGKITQVVFGTEIMSTHFLVYRQLPVVLGAVFAVIAFVQIDIEGKVGRFINQISKYTFGVYLIHSCVFMDTLFWVKLFPAQNMSESPLYFLYVIGTTILMYICCVVVEIIRNIIFRPLENSNIFVKIDKTLETSIEKGIAFLSQIGE